MILKLCKYRAKDSHDIVAHPLTRKLGLLSKDNASRDWWRLLDKGPDP